MEDILIHNGPKFLLPLDLYKLRFTNKFYLDNITLLTIKQSILRQINLRLSSIFGDKLDEFKKLLNDTKGAISGSFIVQCILDEYWNNSDIDIYFPCPTETSPDIGDFFTKVMHLKNSSYDSDEMHNNISKNNIYMITNYEYNGKILQLMYMDIPYDHELLWEFIIDNFDFDFCANIYYIDNAEECVKISKFNNIIRKTDKFSIKFESIQRIMASMDRYYKYTNRGFDISVDTTYDKLANKCIDAVYNTSRKKFVVIKKIFHINDVKITSIDNLYELDELVHKNILVPRRSARHYGMGNNIIKAEDVDYICDNYCILKFCKSNKKHFHYKRDDEYYIFIIQ